MLSQHTVRTLKLGLCFQHLMHGSENYADLPATGDGRATKHASSCRSSTVDMQTAESPSQWPATGRRSNTGTACGSSDHVQQKGTIFCKMLRWELSTYPQGQIREIEWRPGRERPRGREHLDCSTAIALPWPCSLAHTGQSVGRCSQTAMHHTGLEQRM